MVLQIHRVNPQQRLIDMACRTLEEGGIIIYPTDTVYAYGCDIRNPNAIEKVYRIKKIDKKKPLSFVFPDISTISEYAKNVSNEAFKVMKKALPGPYTFIFTATKLVPRIMSRNQKTVGVRVPDDKIALALVKTLGRPILSASVNTAEGDYIVNPSDLDKATINEVSSIIDVGPIISSPSTIIDFSGRVPEIVRNGKGEIFFM